MHTLAPPSEVRARRRSATRQVVVPRKPAISQIDPARIPWIDPESFRAISRHLASFKPSELTATKHPRIWHSQLGNLPILAKVEKVDDERDDIQREYQIGLLINELRQTVPNFAATLGMYTAPPPHSISEPTNHLHHLVLEKIQGCPIRIDMPFDEHLRVLVQLTQALHLAYAKHEFTHYNLHRDNVLLRPLEHEHIIEYSPQCQLQVKSVAVMIDFGRGYTRETGGRAFDIKGVENRPDWSHDITYIFARLLKQYYPAELIKLLDFYSLEFDLNQSTIENLATVRRDSPILRHPDEFLHFIEAEFNFRPNDSKGKAPFLRPNSFNWDATGQIHPPNGADVPTTLAIKIQRRKYPERALHEIKVHQHVQRHHGQTPFIAALRHTFLHDGHICSAYEQHGSSLNFYLDDDGPFPLDQVQRIARQILTALAQLHSCGYAHSDLKPENILWDPATRIAKLADLGNADDTFKRGTSLGSRNYLAPEVLLGAQFTPAIDMWSLGCTLFELLTGEFLFNPRVPAALKYREFYFYEDEDELAESTPEPVAADNRARAAEQHVPGSRLHESYRLEQRLGSGTFGTVWSATLLRPVPHSDSFEALSCHAQSSECPGTDIRSQSEQRDQDWRKTHGAKDLKDLALKYEHLLLIARQTGPLPPSLIADAKFRNTYCDPDGKQLRYRPEIVPLSLVSRLQENLPPAQAHAAEQFLSPLLCADHRLRPTALQALASEWLRD